MKIGVLAVQGAFREHEQILRDLGVETVQVKRTAHLEGLDGLIIPGGESTSIGRLMREYDLIAPIQELAKDGFPLFGTCAGMIVLANKISSGEAFHLGVLDVEVNRNSFGRQKDSFEADVQIPVIEGDEGFPAVFIRAPHIVSVGENVDVLATYEDRIVAVQEGNLMAISFHPELTDDNRIHKYFVDIVSRAKKGRAAHA